MHPPSRKFALERMNVFIPFAGEVYERTRNFDHGNADDNRVSYLSPYLRHRVLLEEEVVAQTLEQHSLKQAEKFIQEVCWRTYFKGYLETRPSIWKHYQESLQAEQAEISGYTKKTLQQAYDSTTGIECFDHWSKELQETGYLHNHTRMWFASIWIFTLRLPWTLGAQFFMRHLMDGDAASNTLSWRWVAGLHTKGKHYLARRSNIEKFTGGRFSPDNLNEDAEALFEEIEFPKCQPLLNTDSSTSVSTETAEARLITEDDLFIEDLLENKSSEHAQEIRFLSPECYEHGYSPKVLDFKVQLMRTQSDRLTAAGFKVQIIEDIESFRAKLAAIDSLSTWSSHQGYANDFLKGLDSNKLKRFHRDWDAKFFSYCGAGFFKVKKQIPKLIHSTYAQ